MKSENAIDTEDDRLAIKDKAPLPALEGGLNDPGIALRPIVAAARDEVNAIAIALNAKTEAVILDLVKPFRPSRNYGSSGGNAALKRLKQASKGGIPG